MAFGAPSCAAKRRRRERYNPSRWSLRGSRQIFREAGGAQGVRMRGPGQAAVFIRQAAFGAGLFLDQASSIHHLRVGVGHDAVDRHAGGDNG